MAGENDLGDLIVTLKLDDTQYRQDVKKALGPDFADALATSERQMKKVIPLSKELNLQAQEAHQRFGVMANAVTGASTTLRLLGIESGFAAVETGRLVLYFGRAITAAGGMASSITIIAKAFKGFWVALGPVGQVLVVTIALYEAITAAMNKAKEKADEVAKAFADQAGAIAAVVESQRELAVARDPNLTHEVNVQRLMDTDSNMTMARAETIVRNKELAAGIIATRALQAKGRKEQRDMELAFQNDEYDRRMKKEEDFWANAERLSEGVHDLHLEQQKELQQLAIEFGGRKPSDFLTGKARDRALFGEAAALRMKGDVGGESGFGIGTLPSSGFRFGAGAVGSVIGEQTEQKKTTEAVERLRQTTISLFNQNFGAQLETP